MASCFAKTGKCIGKCALILVIIGYIILNYAHYATCYIYVGFCTPLTKFTNGKGNRYSVMSEDEYTKSIQEIWHKNYDSTINTTLMKNAANISLAVLLTDTEFESNFISKELNVYQQINIFESDFGTIHDSQSLIGELDTKYNKCIETMKNIKKDSYCFLPIQIKDFPSELYDILVGYIHYHSIMVLQIYRQGLMDSYLDFTSSESIKYTLDSMSIMEGKREKLSKMIKLYPKYIKHQRFDFEDLNGIYAQSYWNGLMTWMGESLSPNKINSIHQSEKDKISIVNSCLNSQQRWDLVQKVLNDTQRYYLCKKYGHQK